MQALTDRAFQRLCELIEEGTPALHPDAVAYSGEAALLHHLIALGALARGPGIAAGILCPWCGATDLLAIRCDGGAYQAFCTECGRVDLTADQVVLLQLDLARMVRWMAAALSLTARFQIEERLPGRLWRLGEIERRRRRYTVFFARGINDSKLAARVLGSLRAVSAPGQAVVLTTSSELPEVLTAQGDAVVPLQAVAHLRKAGFVIENLPAYLDRSGRVDPTNETSLRLLGSHHIVLIDGDSIAVTRQISRFLKVLLDAEGDEVDKETIAAELNIPPTFKPAEIFKRHRRVLETFVRFDRKGRYWLPPEFVGTCLN